MDAGRYNRKFVRLPYKTTIEPEYGQHETTHPRAAQEYWGSLQEIEAVEVEDRGRTVTVVTGVIRIRNRPALDQRDKLRDKATGHEYDIAGIIEGNNELVVQVTR